MNHFRKIAEIFPCAFDRWEQQHLFHARFRHLGDLFFDLVRLANEAEVGADRVGCDEAAFLLRQEGAVTFVESLVAAYFADE